MELQKRPVRYYETVMDAGANKEDSVDLIVPDSYPDIGRILDTQGICCVKERNLREGMAEVVGVCRISLLYLPDDSESDGPAAIRKMDVTMPFDHQFEQTGLDPGCVLGVSAKLLDADARAVNSRKVQVGVSLRVECVALKSSEWELVSGVSADPELGLEQRTDAYSAWVPVAAHSRDFQISDELEIPGSRPALGEILAASVRLAARDPRPLGNKAVFKGEAMVKLLYSPAGNGGELCVTEQELPFSQIIELEGLEDNSDCQVRLNLAGVELEPRGGDGAETRRVGVTLHVNAFARAWSDKHLEAVGDVYSTRYDIRPETTTLHTQQLQERGSKRQNVREVLETDHPVQSVIDSRVTLASSDGTHDVEAHCAALYRDESGALHAVHKRVPVSCPQERPEGQKLDTSPSLAGEITAAGMSDGIELRFGVDFDIMLTKAAQTPALSGLTGDTETPLDDAGRPSVVLRRMSRDDNLWDLAKQYRTTRADLKTANDLESEESAVPGTLLLVPRCR